MGKAKGRGDEHACRVNFLFQAGEKVSESAPELSQYYGQTLTVITEKTAPKKDYTMKRLMCKRCHAILKIGVNASYRLRKNKRQKRTPNVIIGCNLCGNRKRIPTRRSYKLNAEVNGNIIGGNGNLAGQGQGSKDRKRELSTNTSSEPVAVTASTSSAPSLLEPSLDASPT